ncbi:nicotinate-nucleotide--dimethylbenzimidazole phosphoribosyltransferase [Rhabdothermincola sediminis]|uniref:nicotinate-nucleotide--dimethylbenzimidazole phosphoribosyltransferase n=1 Tax=Rhabdothermincola sediminis TaxID=2751370 RepID=UPI001AA0AC33|nr:nicotinate-nucleotide--dimethylbenzimidazole phosphoribosyltransferase [Rhabdothermincola sediminis]
MDGVLSGRAGQQWVEALAERVDAVLFDVGGTLVEQAPAATPLAELVPVLRPGVVEALQVLDGSVRLGVVTNTAVMDAEQVRAHLRSVGIGELFETVVATAPLGVHKPDPAPLRVALDQLGVSPGRALYIGDTVDDERAADAAGATFAFVGVDLAWTVERAARSALASRAGWVAPPLRGPDPGCAAACQDRFDRLAKPPGSLGVLEETLCRSAGLLRQPLPPVDPAVCAVFVADHGVAEPDVVTPWPWTISRQVAGLLASGRGLGSTLARSAGVSVEVIDVGLATGSTPPGVVDQRVRSGTRDIRSGMTLEPEEVEAALTVGIRTAERLVAGGARTLCVGEVGIGNTTVAAAMLAWSSGEDPMALTGRGAGIPDDALERKRRVVADAVAAVPVDAGPLEALSRLGGLEVAAIAGFVMGAASIGVPVVLDGVVTVAAAVVAERLVPGVRDAMVASHRSPEPAAAVGLELLGLRPLFELGVRTGEGGGAILAVPLLRAAREALVGTATLDEL